jgi:hydroxymethylglutaryl-CoA lyase
MEKKKFIIHEVGLRDGLQIEREVVSTEVKIKWAEKLISSGIDIIQLGSFVNLERVPQMADTDKLFMYFKKERKDKYRNIIFSGLVLNEKGLERGMKCDVDLFCMGVSASETHSQKNTGMSIEEALGRITNMAKEAMSAGKQVQASVQSAFGCGYEGIVPPERVLKIVSKYLETGIRNISLADTAGHAHPAQVEKLYEEIFKLDDKINAICHFHETYGLGLVNCYAAMKIGVSIFETAFGGLGGCPFTAKASGNVCTEDFVHLLHRIGIRTDIRLDDIIDVSKDATEYFKRELPGIIYRIGPMNS